MARKRAMEQLRPRTPEALQGRKHIDVQTGKTFLFTSAEYSVHYEFVKCAFGQRRCTFWLSVLHFQTFTLKN